MLQGVGPICIHSSTLHVVYGVGSNRQPVVSYRLPHPFFETDAQRESIVSSGHATGAVFERGHCRIGHQSHGGVAVQECAGSLARADGRELYRLPRSYADTGKLWAYSVHTSRDSFLIVLVAECKCSHCAFHVSCCIHPQALHGRGVVMRGNASPGLQVGPSAVGRMPYGVYPVHGYLLAPVDRMIVPGPYQSSSRSGGIVCYVLAASRHYVE
jgi:hypothetical protein